MAKMNYGNPKPGEAGLNYDRVYSPKPTMGSSKVGARAKQPGSPTGLNQGGAGKTGGRGPKHYGERAKTKITQVGWPGSAAPSSAKPTGGRGPKH